MSIEEEYKEIDYSNIENIDMRDYFDFSEARYGPVLFNEPSGLEFVSGNMVYESEEQAIMEGERIKKMLEESPMATNKYMDFVIDMNDVQSVPGYLPMSNREDEEYFIFVFILKRNLQ